MRLGGLILMCLLYYMIRALKVLRMFKDGSACWWEVQTGYIHTIANIFTFVCVYGVLLGQSSMTQSGFQTRKVMAMRGEGKPWEEQPNDMKEFQTPGLL